GLNQRRSSPHTHLVRLRDLPAGLRPVRIQVKAGISQWGVFANAGRPAAALPGTPARGARQDSAAEPGATGHAS
ncbi:MAG TPA: hypothetical protein VHA75_15095, partial [Rugosimonospora sp.]|nr:hypothetical protein [Rugosimonospora sp.]